MRNLLSLALLLPALAFGAQTPLHNAYLQDAMNGNQKKATNFLQVQSTLLTGALDGTNIVDGSVNSNKFDTGTRTLLGGGSVTPAQLSDATNNATLSNNGMATKAYADTKTNGYPWLPITESQVTGLVGDLASKSSTNQLNTTSNALQNQINGSVVGVASFNGRTSAVTLATSDVIAVLQPSTNVFYIQSFPNPNGNGSQANPFDGSTQGNFDGVMSNLCATNVALDVHLLPGTYRTAPKFGGVTPVWGVKSNMRLIGSGAGVTRVKLADSAPAGSWVIRCWPETCTNKEVSDLTADCNGSASAGTNTSGVGLTGKQGRMRNVQAVNAIGSYTYQLESFPLQVGDPRVPATPSDYSDAGNIIENCEVSSVLGNYCSAFSSVGGGGFYGNRVYFPIVTNGIPGTGTNACFMSAYNMAAANVDMAGNFSFGGTDGIYSDTYACTNLMARGNIFIECLHGATFGHAVAGQPICNVSMIGNMISISRYGSSGVSKYGLQCIGIADQNFDFSKNWIFGVGSTNFAVLAQNITGLQVSGNHWPTTFAFSAAGSVNWSAFENLDLSGIPITSVSQTNRMDTALANVFVGNGAGLVGIPESAVMQLIADLASKATGAQLIGSTNGLPRGVTGTGQTVSATTNASGVVNLNVAADVTQAGNNVMAGSNVYSGPVLFTGQVTISNGSPTLLSFTQTNAVPTNAVPASDASHTNWLEFNLNGIMYYVATNFSSGGWLYVKSGTITTTP